MDVSNVEQTLVLIKHEALESGLVGRVLTEFEQRGLKIAALKMVSPTRRQLERHYPADTDWLMKLARGPVRDRASVPSSATGDTKSDIRIGIGKREEIIDYMMRGQVLAMVLEGPHAIALTRKIAGPTEPLTAPSYTIRGMFSGDSIFNSAMEGRATNNIVHASDTPKNARREKKIWFGRGEKQAEYMTIAQKAAAFDVMLREKAATSQQQSRESKRSKSR
jgi:nucleoside-diphosphate kinase